MSDDPLKAGGYLLTPRLLTPRDIERLKAEWEAAHREPKSAAVVVIDGDYTMRPADLPEGVMP